MGKIFFVTGTDTGIGKTYVTTGLLRVANSRGLSTIGIKPVSSGCMTNHVRTYHHDATLLQETASLLLCYESINPFAFMPPVAPHIIAAELNTELSAATLISRTQAALSTTAAIHMVEGFGRLARTIEFTRNHGRLCCAIGLWNYHRCWHSTRLS